jgi:pyrroline-5-carboxylate reductase
MRPALTGAPLFVSIMAGVRLERIAAALPGSRVVRVMPNLGVTVGEAYSMWIGGPGVTDTDRALVRRLLGAAGREHEAPAEDYLDMATAVAGSGPGYVTLLIEALIDGAVHIGLPREIAAEMVLQTVLGTVRWAQADGGHPAALRAQVVSPGGTTAEGVYALERGGVRAALVAAVIAGFEKSRALGA